MAGSDKLKKGGKNLEKGERSKVIQYEEEHYSAQKRSWDASNSGTKEQG